MLMAKRYGEREAKRYTFLAMSYFDKKYIRKYSRCIFNDKRINHKLKNAKCINSKENKR